MNDSKTLNIDWEIQKVRKHYNIYLLLVLCRPYFEFSFINVIFWQLHEIKKRIAQLKTRMV